MNFSRYDEEGYSHPPSNGCGESHRSVHDFHHQVALDGEEYEMVRLSSENEERGSTN